MKEIPSMEKMIEDCEKKKRDDEQIVFAIGSGRIMPKLGMMKRMNAAMDLITKQNGFIGVHPVDLWRTLLIFDTLNNAKGARNVLINAGIPLGQIVPILVEKKYIKEN